MTITIEQIKQIREITGVGILDCKKALQEADGDFDKAVSALREKGMAQVEKRGERETSEGVLEIYSHGDGRVGVMVEVNCETDFVARSKPFRYFAHELALQIAAMSPKWVTDDDIPVDVIEEQRKEAREFALEQGKPEHIMDRIIDGRLDKFKDDYVLMRQDYIRDDSITIEKLYHQNVASIGENVVIRRFTRWELGESDEE